MHRVLVLAIAVLAFGTLALRLSEGWAIFDCLYFTVISVTTVGYGEMRELSDRGRLIIMMTIGGGLVVTGMAVNFIGLNLLNRFHTRQTHKMERLIHDLSQHVVLCGHGRLGAIVRRELEAAGRRFVVIDEDPEIVSELRSQDHPCLLGDATDEDLLLEAGIARAGGVIAAIGSDAGNVFITLTTREHNSSCPIVARAEEPSTERKLRLVGATRVVTPYQLGGRRLAHAFLRPSAVELADLALGGVDHDVLIEDVLLPSGEDPKPTSLRQLDLGNRFGVIAVAVRRAGNDRPEFNPGADLPLAPGDALVLMGLRENLEQCLQSLQAV